MKRFLVKSVHGAFGYVMEHYYPFGMAAEAAEQGVLTDTYAVISIQDSHTQRFGVQFTENQFCKGVLTLMFDDIVSEEAEFESIKFIDSTCFQLMTLKTSTEQTNRMSNKVETKKKCGIIREKRKGKCHNGRINGDAGMYRR